MSQHTQGTIEVVNDTGSWSAEYDGEGTTCHVGVAIEGGPMIALAVAYSPNIFADPDPSANARRLVACWNACEGLSTELLENVNMLGDTLADRFKALRESESELMVTVDELFQALKTLVDCSNYGPVSDTADAWVDARAAIKKAEG